jgi:D-aspartate ligase
VPMSSRRGIRSGLPRAILVEPNDGCLTIARRLAARGVEVVALCTPTTAWVGRSRSLRALSVGPLPDAAVSGWLPALSRLADRPGVLISGSDAASEFLSHHRDAIPPDLVSFEGSDSAHLALMDKDTLFRLAATVGVLVPRTVRVDQAGDLDRLQELAGPWVVKPVLGHQGRRAGNFSTQLLTDHDEMRRHVGAALEARIPMLISDGVPGATTALEGAITLRTADGACPLEAGRRKIRDYDHGVGSLVESYPATEAIEQAQRLLKAGGYVGLAATEFKRHAGNGRLYLIEINVRVPQYFGVYDAAGTDAAWRLYASLAGLPLGEQPPARTGRKVWMPQHDLHVLHQLRRRERVGARRVLSSLRGTRDFGALSWRDPGPALALVRAEFDRLRSRPR